jgi:hypothetical protein
VRSFDKSLLKVLKKIDKEKLSDDSSRAVCIPKSFMSNGSIVYEILSKPDASTRPGFVRPLKEEEKDQIIEDGKLLIGCSTKIFCRASRKCRGGDGNKQKHRRS